MADQYDPNIQAAQYRAQEIDTQIAAAQADLAAYNLNQDRASAASAVQQIATLSREREDLHRLYNQYVQSQQPQYGPEPTKEERAARPWDRMDARDVLDMTRTSKYAKDIDWRDPHMRAGYAEAIRRKTAGER
jgi:hypothetical protein